ncbi:MAG: hypothetical protein KGY67_07850 [Candidatus Thermoplasmatota archaeon]|nr:hypothetical protein [Candidatus Thermoplasmatota archaeon]
MNQQKKKSCKIRRSIGFITISLIFGFVISVGLFPVIAYGFIIHNFLYFGSVFFWILLPFLIYIGLVIALCSEILISGFFIWLFHVQYEPGMYPYEFRNKQAFKWILICSLYTPFRKIMEIVPVGGVKNVYYKMLGMHIGENTLVGGVIKDPCVTSFGKNTTMGEYALIYGHITNYQKGMITIKKTVIGDNCVIGAGSIIMPGVTIEDDVIVAAGALVTQDQHLKKGCIYAGVPVKLIGKNKES